MSEEKSFFKRPIRYALIGTIVLMFFVTFRLLIGERVGTTYEIAIRYILAWPVSFVFVYITLLLYLYFNPDADKPRKGGKS